MLHGVLDYFVVYFLINMLLYRNIRTLGTLGLGVWFSGRVILSILQALHSISSTAKNDRDCPCEGRLGVGASVLITVCKVTCVFKVSNSS